MRGDVFDVLDAYEEAGFRNVELGSSHPYNENISPATIETYDFNFLVHNYFPPSRDLFVINIASQNKTILKRSLDQLKTSIDLCDYLGATLFTFHSGFRVDPGIDFRFKTDNIVPYGAAMKTMVQSLVELNKHAKDRGIKIAIENNVLAAHNLVNGENELLTMCEYWEFEHLFREICSDNLGILLDLGHLNVTANTLGFDVKTFIYKLKDRVFAVHLHENNGKVDEHRCPKEGDWSLEIVDKYFKEIPVVLECRCDDINKLIKTKEMIERSMKS
jgi:sugar phosphate isomerase/epimerase